jgi:Domain of unknown function (DUF5615)
VSRIRYLLDEDTPHAIRDQLLGREPDIEVLAVGGEMAPAIGTLDPQLLQWIEREGFVLVSRNRRTLPRHLREHLEAGGHVPGIFLLRRQSSLGQIIDDLILIRAAGRPDEYVDQLVYLPL